LSPELLPLNGHLCIALDPENTEAPYFEVTVMRETPTMLIGSDGRRYSKTNYVETGRSQTPKLKLYHRHSAEALAAKALVGK
jgi:hypothetical protein